MNKKEPALQVNLSSCGLNDKLVMSLAYKPWFNTGKNKTTPDFLESIIPMLEVNNPIVKPMRWFDFLDLFLAE